MLPPPEKLKGKILIKDKLMRRKGESSSNFSTLQRGASMTMEAISEEGKKQSSEGTESPLPTVPGELGVLGGWGWSPLPAVPSRWAGLVPGTNCPK